MTNTRTICLIATLMLAGNATAQVYQCSSAVGKQVFQDRPCAGAQAGGEIEVKTHVPSAEQQLKAKIKGIEKQIAADEAVQKARHETAEIVAKRESLQAERKRQCDYYSRDYQHYETSGRYAYFRNNRAMYFEKARQAYEGVKKYCD